MITTTGTFPAAARGTCDQRFDVGAHQIEFVDVVVLRRMDSDLRRRQAEDQPPMPDIDAGKLQYIAQEGAVGLRIRAVDNRVRSSNQRNIPPFPPTYSHTPGLSPGKKLDRPSAHATQRAIQYAGNKMKTSHTFRLALVPGENIQDLRD